MNTLERLVSLEKRLNRLENFIKELSIYSNMNHSEDCSYVHPMSMSNYCSCHLSLWLELQKVINDEK